MSGLACLRSTKCRPSRTYSPKIVENPSHAPFSDASTLSLSSYLRFSCLANSSAVSSVLCTSAALANSSFRPFLISSIAADLGTTVLSIHFLIELVGLVPCKRGS